MTGILALIISGRSFIISEMVVNILKFLWYMENIAKPGK